MSGLSLVAYSVSATLSVHLQHRIPDLEVPISHTGTANRREGLPIIESQGRRRDDVISYRDIVAISTMADGSSVVQLSWRWITKEVAWSFFCHDDSHLLSCVKRLVARLSPTLL